MSRITFQYVPLPLPHIQMLMCTGGAVLGSRTTATVTIARTGYAYGKFGFRGSTTLTAARSATATTVALMLERTVGRLGNQIVSVELMYIDPELN